GAGVSAAWADSPKRTGPRKLPALAAVIPSRVAVWRNCRRLIWPPLAWVHRSSTAGCGAEPSRVCKSFMSLSEYLGVGACRADCGNGGAVSAGGQDRIRDRTDQKTGAEENAQEI